MSQPMTFGFTGKLQIYGEIPGMSSDAGQAFVLADSSRSDADVLSKQAVLWAWEQYLRGASIILQRSCRDFFVSGVWTKMYFTVLLHLTTTLIRALWAYRESQNCKSVLVQSPAQSLFALLSQALTV